MIKYCDSLSKLMTILDNEQIDYQLLNCKTHLEVLVNNKKFGYNEITNMIEYDYLDNKCYELDNFSLLALLEYLEQFKRRM